MIYNETDYLSEEDKKETKYGIDIYDGKGNQYHINTNPFGELEITTHDGNILINPRYANQIIIKTE